MVVQFGWVVYALAVPAVIVSLILLIGGKSWHLWLGGSLFAAWAILGYVIDIARLVAWRSPIIWPVFAGYFPLRHSPFLFDLETDANESYSLVESLRATAAELAAMLDAWNGEMATSLHGWLP